LCGLQDGGGASLTFFLSTSFLSTVIWSTTKKGQPGALNFLLWQGPTRNGWT